MIIKDRSNRVLIRDSNGNIFKAYLKNQIGFDIDMQYDSLFKEYMDWRNMLTKLTIAGGIASEKIIGENDFQKSMNGAFTAGTAFTKKFGGVPDFLSVKLDCRVWAEDNKYDVKKALDILYDLSVPPISSGLSIIPLKEVEVHIGGWFVIEKGVIERISHKFSEVFVEGEPYYCDVAIDVSSSVILERDMLRKTFGRVTVGVSK